METQVKALHRTAKSIGLASMWRVQREHCRVPILLGPLVPADIMLAAFRSACNCFKVVIYNITCENVEDALEPPDFDWGDYVEAFRDWASSIKLLNRPARKAAPRYTREQCSTPKKSKGSKQSAKESGPSACSPSQMRTWYAAKDTARPGGCIRIQGRRRIIQS